MTIRIRMERGNNIVRFPAFSSGNEVANCGVLAGDVQIFVEMKVLRKPYYTIPVLLQSVQSDKRFIQLQKV